MIDIRVRKNPQNLEQVINDAPRNARGRMTKAASVYLIGNERRGLKHYPTYRYVTRKKAFGRSFFSKAQRGKVMAMIREGLITPGVPRRTFAIRNAWKIREDGVRTLVYNDAKGVNYVMGNDQSRHEKLAGWRQDSEIVESNRAGMVQEAQRELVRYLREKGITVK